MDELSSVDSTLIDAACPNVGVYFKRTKTKACQSMLDYLAANAQAIDLTRARTWLESLNYDSDIACAEVVKHFSNEIALYASESSQLARARIDAAADKRARREARRQADRERSTVGANIDITTQ